MTRNISNLSISEKSLLRPLGNLSSPQNQDSDSIDLPSNFLTDRINDSQNLRIKTVNNTQSSHKLVGSLSPSLPSLAQHKTTQKNNYLGSLLKQKAQSYNNIGKWCKGIQVELDQLVGQQISNQYKKDIIDNTIEKLKQAMEILNEITQMHYNEVLTDYQLCHLDKLLQGLKTLEIKTFYIKLIILKAKCTMARGDLYKSMKLLRDVKSYFNINSPYSIQLKLSVYKHLGDILIFLRRHDKAKINYVKLLNLAWYLNNKNYELHAYDKLALCFYYSGQQEKAQILHNKAMDGKVEPSKTRVRQFGAQKALQRTTNRNKRLPNQQSQQLNYAAQIEDSSSGEDGAVEEIISNYKLDVLSSQIKMQKQKKLIFLESDNKIPFHIQHQSNNRQKRNYQVLGFVDLLNNAVNKNEDYKFIWKKVTYIDINESKDEVYKYLYRLKKYKEMLNYCLQFLNKQVDKQQGNRRMAFQP